MNDLAPNLGDLSSDLDDIDSELDDILDDFDDELGDRVQIGDEGDDVLQIGADTSIQNGDESLAALFGIHATAITVSEPHRLMRPGEVKILEQTIRLSAIACP
ncbi:MAG: hypothetical protein ACFE0I_13285 [Elainellaceae cyanobacterium]